MEKLCPPAASWTDNFQEKIRRESFGKLGWTMKLRVLIYAILFSTIKPFLNASKISLNCIERRFIEKAKKWWELSQLDPYWSNVISCPSLLGDCWKVIVRLYEIVTVLSDSFWDISEHAIRLLEKTVGMKIHLECKNMLEIGLPCCSFIFTAFRHLNWKLVRKTLGFSEYKIFAKYDVGMKNIN